MEKAYVNEVGKDQVNAVEELTHKEQLLRSEKRKKKTQTAI